MTSLPTSSRRGWFAGFTIAVGCGLIAAAAVWPMATHAAEPVAKFGTLVAGTQVPDFKVVGADGKDVKLSDFKGRVVVVGFWSANRGPGEVLQSAFLQYQDLGLAAIGVCSGSTREEFNVWVEKTKESLAYPLAWDPAGKARAESVSQKVFGLGVFPATGVIDRDGKVVGGFVGFGPQAVAILRGYLRAAGLAIPADEVPKPAEGTGPDATTPPVEDKTLKPGAVAPDFVSLDGAGSPVKLADFAGKIVVLDFWAPLCAPCVASMPHTQAIAAATKSQGVVVLAACTSDTREHFETWLKANAARYPDVVFANDPLGRDAPPERYAERTSVKLYGVNVLPTQFVIGRDGKIAEVLRGYGEGDTRLERALEQLGVKTGGEK
jgi:peroxiredoxin